jgi:hypothetical protein
VRHDRMKLTLRQLKVLRAIARLTQAPLSGPMLRRVGINLDEPANLVHDIDMFIELQKDFNEMFASRGWVVHDWIDVRAAHRALSLAKAGDFAAADEVLVRAYTVESVRHGLQQMRNRRWFAKRHELALLALADFEAERFHASVPVVLLLIDGLGKDLTGAGFLRQGVRFAKEDSFLEIGPGLTTLLSTMTASRGSTSTDTISVPHRHGIMHGVDLGYGNVLVAAKAWGALLAIGAHASQLEDSRSVPAPPPLKGLRGQLRDLADSAQRTTAFKRLTNGGRGIPTGSLTHRQRRERPSRSWRHCSLPGGTAGGDRWRRVPRIRASSSRGRLRADSERSWRSVRLDSCCVTCRTSTSVPLASSLAWSGKMVRRPTWNSVYGMRMKKGCRHAVRGVAIGEC